MLWMLSYRPKSILMLHNNYLIGVRIPCWKVMIRCTQPIAAPDYFSITNTQGKRYWSERLETYLAIPLNYTLIPQFDLLFFSSFPPI